MSDQDLETPAENSDQNAPANPPAETVDPYAAVLSSITNASGETKFQSVDVALQSIQPQSEHINRLEAENKELREAAVKSQTAEEIVQKLLTEQKPAGEPPAQPTLDQDGLVKLMADVIKANETDKVQANNQQQFTKHVVDTYGDKAEETLNSRRKELGISQEFLNEMIAQSPKAALQSLGLKEAAPSTPGAIQGSQNTSNFEQAPNPKLDLSIFTGGNDDLMSKWAEAKQTIK